MPIVHVPATGVTPCQIDVPEKLKLARSGKGSIHVAPGVTLELTDDELGFLKTARPKLHARLRVVTPAPPPPKVPEKAPEAEAEKLKTDAPATTEEPAAAPPPEEPKRRGR